MPHRRTPLRALAAAIAICVAASLAAPALAAPAAQEVAQDRAALNAAVARYQEAQATSAEIELRVLEATAELDGIVAEVERHQRELTSRVVAMYRSDSTTTLALLLGASSIPDLAARLDLIDRMARHNAENLEALKVARVAAEQAATSMLELQSEHVRRLDELAAEVAAARNELAASEAALKEYEVRVAAAQAAAAKAAAAQSSATQQLTGSGEWQTAVASHYSRTFTGTGASGKPIGPYTMMVAHKTLPFGTLVEFEYKGKRAIASVEDRGPYVPGRTWDLGPGVVRALDFNGVHEVRYRIVSR